MRTRPFIFTSFLLFVAISAAAGPQSIDRNFHETFRVEPGARLILRHGDGDVKVSSWDRDEVDVQVRYRMDYKERSVGFGKKRNFTVEFRQLEGDVYVTGHEKGQGVRVGWANVSFYEYTYTVMAPSYIDLEFQGDDGDIHVKDMRGEVDVRTMDGSFIADRLTGDLYLSAADGDIELISCSIPTGQLKVTGGDVRIRASQGNLTIDSEDGDVDLIDMQSDALRITSRDGDVSIALQPSQQLELAVRTLDGDATVRVDPTASAAFTLQTVDGDIQTDVQAQQFSKGDNKVTGTLSGGDGSITITTRDGDIVLISGR